MSNWILQEPSKGTVANYKGWNTRRTNKYVKVLNELAMVLDEELGESANELREIAEYISRQNKDINGLRE